MPGTLQSYATTDIGFFELCETVLFGQDGSTYAVRERGERLALRQTSPDDSSWNDAQLVLRGSNLALDPNGVASGTVTRIEIDVVRYGERRDQLTLYDLELDAQDVVALFEGAQSGGLDEITAFHALLTDQITEFHGTPTDNYTSTRDGAIQEYRFRDGDDVLIVDTHHFTTASYYGGDGRDQIEFHFDDGVVDLAAGTAIGTSDGRDHTYHIESFENGSVVASGHAELRGTDSDNILFASDGSSVLRGRDGNDWLRAWNGEGTLFGGRGNDILEGFDGRYQFFGGQGTDTVIYDLSFVDDTTIGVRVNLETGIGSKTARGDRYDSIENVHGSRYDDILIGNAEANILWGNTGADTLLGSAGDDELNGMSDDDLLRGGSGRDVLNGDDGDDRLFGNTYADTLNGNAGRDTLIGGDGNDTLDGGAQRDTLTGGRGADAFIFQGDTRTDTITDFNMRKDTLQIDSALIDGRDLTDLLRDTNAGLRIEWADGQGVILEGLTLETFNTDVVELI